MSADDVRPMAAIDRARSHPIRRRILLLMRELNNAVSATTCVKHFGDELSLGDNPVSRVTYHMKILREARLIRLSHRKPVRGSTERFYRPTKAFTAEIQDGVAMDRIAEMLSEYAVAGTLDLSSFIELERIVNATGRPTYGEGTGRGPEGR